MTEFDRTADAFAQKLSAAGVGYRYDVVMFVLFSTAGGMLQQSVDDAKTPVPREIHDLLERLREVTTSLLVNGSTVTKES